MERVRNDDDDERRNGGWKDAKGGSTLPVGVVSIKGGAAATIRFSRFANLGPVESPNRSVGQLVSKSDRE